MKTTEKRLKRFAPTKKALKNMEIIVSMPQMKEVQDMLAGNLEYMIIVKDVKTHLLRREGVKKTEAQAKQEVRRLEKRGLDAQWVLKSINANDYEAMYIINNLGISTNIIGLDNALELLNERDRERLGLRKIRNKKIRGEGFAAFAYNSKTGEYVSTRLYDDFDTAQEFIAKRSGVDDNTIIISRCVKYYNGFHFKNQKLDKHHKLKDIKKDLSMQIHG